MSKEIIWSIAVPVATALACIAYYHPRPFMRIAWGYIVAMGLVVIFAKGIELGMAEAIDRVGKAFMIEAQQEAAIAAIKAPGYAPPELMLIWNLIHYGMYYVGALTLLPVVGITDADRQYHRKYGHH